jgi:hypothetical protein
MTIERTGVVTYYAVTLGGIDYTVVDMYSGNIEYSERTIVELETQKKPSRQIQNLISQAIEDFEAYS